MHNSIVCKFFRYKLDPRLKSKNSRWPYKKLGWYPD